MMGLFATYQAALAGAVPPPALDDAVASGHRARVAAGASDAEVDAVLALAKSALDEADAHDAELRDDAQQSRLPSAPAALDRPVLRAARADGRATAVVGLLGAFTSANAIALVENAAVLSPEPAAIVLGSAALARGDFHAALDSAARLAQRGAVHS
jgi:hypothetical protein